MRNPRGFTLLELMIGVAVMSIVLSSVAAAVIGVSGAYNNESQIRSTVEGGRTSLAFLERQLRLAGYGLDPRYAFDFTNPSATVTSKDNHELTGADAFVSDDLAFRYRDPYFLRRGGSGLSGTSLVVDSPFGASFPVGTPFMVACPGAKEYGWYRTSAATTATGTTVAVAAYTGNNSPATNVLTCAGGAGAAAPYVFLLREWRIRVAQDVAGGRPFLVALPNLSTNIGSGDLLPPGAEPLAADVEEFQVSYVMNRPHATSSFITTTPPDGASGNWILMDATGETAPTAVNPPSIDDPYDSAKRYSANLANIRAVRVNLSLRSTRRENSGRQSFPRTPVENSSTAASPAGDGYYRSWITTTVRTPNLLSRSFFLPALTATSGDNLNVNGG